MESRKKEVKKSEYYYLDIKDIYEYGEATFGSRIADTFFDTILNQVEQLETQYLMHPECKTKLYRNIILGSYLIIYRIKPNRIEVLRAFHGSRSPKIIKSAREIKV